MIHKYKLKYRFKIVEVGEFLREEFKGRDIGGCDSIMLTSILYPDDGSYSMMPMTFGPDGKEMAAKEQFKAWVLMGKHISDRLKSTGENARSEIAKMPIEMMKMFFDQKV